jgi:hypothetical protein
MTSSERSRLVPLIPVLSAALLLAACGGGGDSGETAQQAPAPVEQREQTDVEVAAPEAEPAGENAAAGKGSAAAAAPRQAKAAGAADKPARSAGTAKSTARSAQSTKVATKATGKRSHFFDATKVTAIDSAAEAERNARIAEGEDWATDIGVTRNAIRMGTVSMHGMALGNVLVQPVVRGINAAFSSINDQGGILGRRLSLVDCDDGPGEVSRTKACIKKLATADRVFALLNISSWGSASAHDDLKQYKLPSVGQWAYSQTEWQDPYMFPTHMSMIHEAMAGAQWAKTVIKPKTYGLICLTSPEMQLACNEV